LYDNAADNVNVGKEWDVFVLSITESLIARQSYGNVDVNVMVVKQLSGLVSSISEALITVQCV
jgi:hypothetical protein